MLAENEDWALVSLYERIKGLFFFVELIVQTEARQNRNRVDQAPGRQ